VERIEAIAGGARVLLGGGGEVGVERVLVATGRTPNVEGLGLEQLGVEVTKRGIMVDDRLRAADQVWAIGDAAGVGLLTHLGKYQARVAAANIAGEDMRADYKAIPAAVFTDPQVASVGIMDGVTARSDIIGGRLSTYERPKRPGFVKLAADPERRILVGAVAVGPEAGEWLGQLTLAVRAEVPIDVLLDTIQPYPTFSEAIFNALLELEVALSK
jgi:dihydrolipoamide dehydrogenase